MTAGPGGGRNCVGTRVIDQAPRAQCVAVAQDPKLRPAFHEWDFADRATQALVPYVARDAGLLEHVAQVRHLDDRLGRVNLAKVSLPAAASLLR